MPNYDYYCPSCGFVTELNVPMDKRHSQECPKCNTILEIKISPTPTKFKGSGWSIPPEKRNWPQKTKKDTFDVKTGSYVKGR